MLRFNKYNANPKNRRTGDCSTRALAYCLNIPWEEALRLQCEEAIKCKYDPTSREVIERVLRKYGYTKKRQPRKYDNGRFMVKELDGVLSARELSNKVIVNVAKHYVVVELGKYTDTWDSGSRCVGNYYSK